MLMLKQYCAALVTDIAGK